MVQNLRDYLNEHITRAQLLRAGVSLLLAIVLWGWVTQLQDPVQTRRYSEMEIAVPDLPGTIQIVTSLPRATVTLRDVESTLEDVARPDITVTLDVSEVDSPGAYHLPVVVSTDHNLRELDVSPDTVPVQVEEEISRNFPLTIENQLLADNASQIVDVDSNPEVSEVTVTGTESAIGRIARVVLPVTIGEETSDFRDTIEPYAVDENGQRVQEVTIRPDHVLTHVNIVTRGTTVNIVPQITGTPADGFVVQQKVVMPPTVVVDGPPEVLQSLLFVNTEPVDISGATESISQRVQLQDLPEGVSLVDPSDRTVEVRVSIGTSAGTANTVPDMPIRIINLAGDYTAAVDPKTVDVGVSASSDTLTSLTPEDIRVTVDVAGLGPGAYNLAPDVDVPDDVQVTSLQPGQVVVLISDETATPVRDAGANHNDRLALLPD